MAGEARVEIVQSQREWENLSKPTLTINEDGSATLTCRLPGKSDQVVALNVPQGLWQQLLSMDPKKREAKLLELLMSGVVPEKKVAEEAAKKQETSYVPKREKKKEGVVPKKEEKKGAEVVAKKQETPPPTSTTETSYVPTRKDTVKLNLPNIENKISSDVTISKTAKTEKRVDSLGTEYYVIPFIADNTDPVKEVPLTIVTTNYTWRFILGFGKNWLEGRDDAAAMIEIKEVLREELKKLRSEKNIYTTNKWEIFEIIENNKEGIKKLLKEARQAFQQ